MVFNGFDSGFQKAEKRRLDHHGHPKKKRFLGYHT